MEETDGFLKDMSCLIKYLMSMLQTNQKEK